jgi:antitoxin-like ribbon-helix-helix protein
MSSKIAAIQQQLEKAVGRVAPTPAIADPVAAPPSQSGGSSVAPSRVGKVHIGAYLHPDFKRSLRLVQAQTDKSLDALLTQALNELFRRYNVPVVDRD